MAWAAFYHLVFKTNPDFMKREDVSEVLRKINNVFEVPLSYYRKSNAPDGFERVNWKIR